MNRQSQKIKSFIVQEACTDDAAQTADDLKLIFKYDLVDSTIKEILEQQQQFLYKHLPSSTIPMYKQVDECAKAENASTVKMDNKKFNQIAEVEANNGQTIFIQKHSSLVTVRG